MFSQGCGVMGIVNVPYLVLEPTHNKQDFADGKVSWEEINYQNYRWNMDIAHIP